MTRNKVSKPKKGMVESAATGLMGLIGGLLFMAFAISFIMLVLPPLYSVLPFAELFDAVGVALEGINTGNAFADVGLKASLVTASAVPTVAMALVPAGAAVGMVKGAALFPKNMKKGGIGNALRKMAFYTANLASGTILERANTRSSKDCAKDAMDQMSSIGNTLMDYNAIINANTPSVAGFESSLKNFLTDTENLNQKSMKEMAGQIFDALKVQQSNNLNNVKRSVSDNSAELNRAIGNVSAEGIMAEKNKEKMTVPYERLKLLDQEVMKMIEKEEKAAARPAAGAGPLAAAARGGGKASGAGRGGSHAAKVAGAGATAATTIGRSS